jgi:hypothetical protein
MTPNYTADYILGCIDRCFSNPDSNCIVGCNRANCNLSCMYSVDCTTVAYLLWSLSHNRYNSSLHRAGLADSTAAYSYRD